MDKYKRFIKSILWQIAVLALVYYATVETDSIAITIVEWYVYLVVAVNILFIMLISTSDEFIKELAEKQDSKIYESIAPSSVLTHHFSSLVSVIEIVLFVMAGWNWSALIWGIGQVSQHLWLKKLKAIKNET